MYIVTGGAGFIGSNITEELLMRGESVRVLDNFSTGRHANLDTLIDHPQLDIIEGDIRSLAVCEKAVKDADYVIHLAALGSIPRSLEDPVTSNDVNVGGTLNMLQAARGAGITRFVYAGSSSSYGDNPSIPKKETDLGRPLSPYAISKLAGELYCRSFGELFDLPVVCLRFFNVFGPRQDPESAYAAVVPIFFRQLLRGKSPTIHGDGEQTRDFTYVGNVVNANLLACTAGDSCLGQVYNIAGGQRISVNRLFKEIQQLTGADIEPEYDPQRPGDIRDSQASCEAALRDLGYEAHVDVFQGLKKTLDWYQRTVTIKDKPVG